MMDGAHRFVERKIADSVQSRQRHWKRDLSSPEAYERSVRPNREQFRTRIGLADARGPAAMERFTEHGGPELVSETDRLRIYQVRWPALEGVHGEGLLLEPKQAPLAYVVALPDANQSPEQIAGLNLAQGGRIRFALRLAERGCLVLVPALIDRASRWSGHPDIRMTDQTHREWIYRQAFHMGRHIIGYEVQKVLAAVDWFRRAGAAPGKVGIAGYGEGGLIAFYAAAADTRIDAALVSGYFGPRERVWSEPIYRNIWGLLEEFGDAEIATLVAPRGLVVEHTRAPEVKGHKGDLTTPEFAEVQGEFDRIDRLTRPGFQPKMLLRADSPVSAEALEEFLQQLGVASPPTVPGPALADRRPAYDPSERQRRQLQELENHAQALVRNSEWVRRRFFPYKLMPELADRKWSRELRHKTHPAEKFIEGAKWYRDYFRDELIGPFDEPLMAPNPRTRKIYDVVLDVWPDVFAWGVLLVPKDVRLGERRPVVVCQHGRNGLPAHTVEGDDPAYRNFAARLAERGFVVFAPHNLYRGEDRFRWLDRKANALKSTLYSFLLGQHDQILRWLEALPFVDGKRMAFYGLSYGGKTAMRVPAILEKYSAVICSGDFNNWTWKVAATDEWFSYMYTIEWEMFHFNLGNTFDYAEMAYLIFPRPFMVERGHHDHVAEDRWVAYEYAKVQWLYAQLALPERTEIEYFNGGHTINGEGTFRFLHKHLKWPEPGQPPPDR